MAPKSCTPESLCFIFPLEKRKILKKAILAVWPFLAFFVLISFVRLLFPSSLSLFNFGNLLDTFLALFLVFIAAAFLFFIVKEYLYFNNYFYDVKDGILTVKKGIFIISQVSVPLDKIQDIYIDQDVLDKIFGLYDVHFATAGFGSANIHIDGLNRVNSEQIKNMLIEKKSAPSKKNEP